MEVTSESHSADTVQGRGIGSMFSRTLEIHATRYQKSVKQVNTLQYKDSVLFALRGSGEKDWQSIHHVRVSGSNNSLS